MSISTSVIIERKRIELGDTQKKMIKSGWGENTLNKSVVEKMTYSSDGLNVKGYLAYPVDTTKKYPCIIWNRGGIGEKGVIDTFTAKGIFGQIASWGYVVLASQYRGNAGGEGKDEFGGEDLNDVLNLMPLAEKIQCADIAKWGIEGWSRGGMMTYLTLTKNHNFNCAVISGGIANLGCSSDESRFMRKLFEVTMGDYGDEKFKQKCDARSIVNFPERLSRTTPMLILHGTADNRVLPHDSLDLSYQLLELEIPFRLVMLEGGDHFMRKHRKEVDVMRKNWYKKYLG